MSGHDGEVERGASAIAVGIEEQRAVL